MAALQESVHKAQASRGEDADVHQLPRKKPAAKKTASKKTAAKKAPAKKAARKPRKSA